jgi:membrane-bound lytic murein transglycosylase A
MAALPPRSRIGVGLALCLIAAAGKPAAAHELKFRNAQVEPLAFAKMDGWQDDDHAAAFTAFLKSCSAILQGSRAMRAARPIYGGLYNACERATTLAAAGMVERAPARKFFEDNFKPVRILPPAQSYGFYTGADGFYTGYYEAEFTGSRYPSDEYKIPLYSPPKHLVGKMSKIFSQYDRREIEDGAIAGKGLEICYVKDPVDAFFAQIQGSTRVKLENGDLLRLNYIASNGKPYTPVGRILIDRGIVSKEDMSMDKIREYMEANPEEGEALRMKNRSYVFFTETSLGAKDECIGAQGIPLTPWRSIAVDPSVHVYGTPIWIDAKFPIKSLAPEDTFQHLMVAQDTGSAIRGTARADIYFGHGEDIPHIAGRIKQFGKFVMLVPKAVSVSSSAPETTKDIPLPRPRPKDIVADNVPTGTVTAQPKPRP